MMLHQLQTSCPQLLYSNDSPTRYLSEGRCQVNPAWPNYFKRLVVKFFQNSFPKQGGSGCLKRSTLTRYDTLTAWSPRSSHPSRNRSQLQFVHTETAAWPSYHWKMTVRISSYILRCEINRTCFLNGAFLIDIFVSLSPYIHTALYCYMLVHVTHRHIQIYTYIPLVCVICADVSFLSLSFQQGCVGGLGWNEESHVGKKPHLGSPVGLMGSTVHITQTHRTHLKDPRLEEMLFGKHPSFKGFNVSFNHTFQCCILYISFVYFSHIICRSLTTIVVASHSDSRDYMI